MERGRTDFSNTDADHPCVRPGESTGLAGQRDRLGRQGTKDVSCHCAPYDRQLFCGTTFWTEGSRIRVFGHNAAVVDPGDDLVSARHGCLIQGYRGHSKPAANCKRCRWSSGVWCLFNLRSLRTTLGAIDVGNDRSYSHISRDNLVRYGPKGILRYVAPKTDPPCRGRGRNTRFRTVNRPVNEISKTMKSSLVLNIHFGKCC